jgi:hypothetical protein
VLLAEAQGFDCYKTRLLAERGFRILLAILVQTISFGFGSCNDEFSSQTGLGFCGAGPSENGSLIRNFFL